MDWSELRREFLTRLTQADKALDRSVSDFAQETLSEIKAQGYELTQDLEDRLEKFAQDQEAPLKTLMAEVTLPVIQAQSGLKKKARDKLVDQLVEEVFETEYPDGLKISDRVWNTNKRIKKGLKDTLKKAASSDKATGNVIMEMQTVIEKEAGKEFALHFTDRLPGWLEVLDGQARELMYDPQGWGSWRDTKAEVERLVANLAETGTKRGAQQYLKDIEKALQAGRLELVDKALNNYLYDKQLYALRRIQRTETSNAYQLAQIRATEEDPEIIGYQWLLSSTHPQPDICDWYASVDHGLGKGVWPKKKVPHRKAHPQCLCDLLPTINPEKEEGYKSLDEFLKARPDAAGLKPQWLKDMEKAGAPTSALTGDDGWFSTKKQVEKKLGDKATAGEAIGKAMGERKWTKFKKHASKRMSEGYIKTPDELNQKFEAILADKESLVFAARGDDPYKERYYVLSEKTKEVSIMNGEGLRRTVHPIDKKTVEEHINALQNEAKIKGLYFKELGPLKDLWQ